MENFHLTLMAEGKAETKTEPDHLALVSLGADAAQIPNAKDEIRN